MTGVSGVSVVGGVLLGAAIVASGGTLALIGGIAAGAVVSVGGTGASIGLFVDGAEEYAETNKDRRATLRRKIGPAIDRASGRHGSTVAVQRAMQANVVCAHCDTTSVSTLKNQPPVSAPTLEAVAAGHTWWDVIVDKTGTLASNSKLVSRLYRLVEL